MNELNQRILKCISLFSIDDNISFDDTLIDLGIDSLKIVEIILALEDEFGIEFDASSLNPMELTTTGSLIELVQQYNNGRINKS